MSRRYANEKIIAIAPAFNESGKIGKAVAKVPRDCVDEVLVWNDGSTDSSKQEAQAAGATVMDNATPQGVGDCLRRGFKYAAEKGFTIIIVMAGNDKDDPSEMPRLVDAIVKDGKDFVQGSRHLPGGKYGNMPAYRIFATKVVHPMLMSLATGVKITDSTNGFRAFRTSLLEDPRINLYQDWMNTYELEPYLMMKAIYLGYKFGEAPVTKIYPTKKTTKMRPFVDWFRILKPIFYLWFRIKE